MFILDEFSFANCDCRNAHDQFFCFVNCNSRNPSNAFHFIYAYCDWKMFIHDELFFTNSDCKNHLFSFLFSKL